MFVLHLLIYLHFVALHVPFLADVTLNDLLSYLNKGGVLGILVLLLFGGMRKWWIFGWTYTDSETRYTSIKRERDDWRDMALHSTNLAEQSVDLFHRSRDKRE